jgi:hypothetical protein
MEKGKLQKLIDVLAQAFIQLNSNVPTNDIEDMAVAVHRVLSVETRHFHNVEHVLSLADPSAPIRSLAAVFHDLVYYQIESGFSPPVYDILSPYLLETDKDTILAENPAVSDLTFEILRDVFAISTGQALSKTNGINEFLSALVAWKKLEPFLSETDLLKIAIHIEATIPFRGNDEKEVGRFDVLAARVMNVVSSYGISLSGKEIDETIHSAVIMANQDVVGFAHPDPAVFLDNTWKLLPEVNAELRSGKIYSISDYRQALQKMDSFFAILEPQNIFHSYKGVPNEPDMGQMIKGAQFNLEIAREYLCAKLLAIAILEALAEITGGETPLGLFMGDIQSKGDAQQRLENFLPAITPTAYPELNSTVQYLLEEGRPGQSQFDLQNAPLALYLYKCLGRNGCEVLVSAAQEMFAGKRNPTNFLNSIDPPVISAIANACAQMVPTREKMLNQFASTVSER